MKLNGPRNRGSHPLRAATRESDLYLSCAYQLAKLHSLRSVVKLGKMLEARSSISRSKPQREFNPLDDETVIQNQSPLP
jgi:hypothetical protein